ncbi:recombinase family protein [Gottfriedia sp. NPDC056225]|uniref:recombinase family protein n=1 Tax=Gottfriedia sp. NPDC056225 TaxID=3345751 RepID=UPI0035DC5134
MNKAGKIDDTRSIAIYCRVSTDEQAREGLSLDDQQSRLSSYCIAMDWKQDITYYIDDGYSAKNIERPQLIRLLEDVKQQKISRVIVTKLDRMSRKLLNLLELIELFQQYGVSFISISESFDTHTPSGRLTLQVLGAVAEFERERIRERVIDTMFHAANQGKWLSSAPYGYQLVDKLLIVKVQEASVVKRIFELYKEGNGYINIAKILNNEGILSPGGKDWWNRSVKLILSNPVYKGTTIWNRRDRTNKKEPQKDMEEWIIQENTHEAIIEPALWEAVQVKMSGRKTPNRSKNSPYLLSGLLKCPVCGSGMSVTSSGSKNSPYKAYRCSAYSNKGSCTGKQYKVEVIDELFKKGLEELLEKIPSLEFVVSQKTASSPYSSTSKQQKIHVAQKRYERKVEAYTAGLIGLEDLKAEKSRLDILEESLKLFEEDIVDLNELKKELKNVIKSVIVALENLPTAKVRELLGELIEKVTPSENEKMNIVLKDPI